MSELLTTDSLVALLTLTSLEIVLGIDNIVFIAIVAGKLPPEQRDKARLTGLALAVITRLMLLLTLFWMASLISPLFHVGSHPFSGRDIVLLSGGLFLIWKATKEIHTKLEGHADEHAKVGKTVSFSGVITQILIIDLIFSLDSVITAVGMTDKIPVMVLAVILSIIMMLVFSKGIIAFIERHPTVKMLALSFLLLIGVMLVAEGTGQHVEKGYIYFAMAFSLLVEMLNLRAAARREAQPSH